MPANYFAALLTTTMVSLSALGADKLCVIFPENTNLVFTVPIHGKSGERPYDFFLEYPTEYEDDGRPTNSERTGLGFYIYIEVIDEMETSVKCKLKVDRHHLSDWIPYTYGELVILQPVFSSFATDTVLTLPIGKWFILDSTGLKNNQPLNLKVLFQRVEESRLAPSDGRGEAPRP